MRSIWSRTAPLLTTLQLGTRPATQRGESGCVVAFGLSMDPIAGRLARHWAVHKEGSLQGSPVGPPSQTLERVYRPTSLPARGL